MSYQVLARKWRPQIFADLVGQEHVATTLLNALKSNRMPHALLFTGARGVGKTSAARILAKNLRCPSAKDFVPCNECVDCQEITSGQAIDVIEIDGASNNGVESIRELRSTVGYMPSRGKYKVYIIDEVHMLSTSAFNALLKTLEEPPPHVVFIFATTEPHKIPVTILSRCQRFDFRRIPVRKVAEHLKRVADQEGVKSDQQSLWLIARESEGSMRDSQSLLDQVITFSGSQITYQKVVEVLGLTDRTLLGDTLKAVIERDPQKCLDIIERVFNFGYDPKQFAQDILEHIRNLMIVKVSGQNLKTDFLDLPDTEIAELAAWAEKVSEEDIQLLFDMTLKGVGDVVRSQDPRIVLEMVLLRLSQAPSLQSIEKLIQHLENGGEMAKAAFRTPPVHQPPSTPTPARNMTSSSENLPLGDWSQLVAKIKKDKPLLGAKLEYSSLVEADNERLVIGFKKEQEFIFNQVNTPETLKTLADLTKKYWGHALKLEIKIGAGNASPKEMADHAKQEADQKVREKIESHPLIKEAKNVFKTGIKSIKEST